MFESFKRDEVEWLEMKWVVILRNEKIGNSLLNNSNTFKSKIKNKKLERLENREILVFQMENLVLILFL